ncbi:MAG: hypothetical protein WB611_28130 [Stellaceae bacterium]
MATLPFGPLTQRSVHLCIDMQNLFAGATPWHTPWMTRVLPVVEEIAGRHASQTVFTRFIPPAKAEDVSGTWQRYFQRWAEMTRDVTRAPRKAALAAPRIVFGTRALLL